MKNSEILTAYETLERITQNKELKFNVTVGYMLAKNKAKLRQEANIIYDQRRKILMEHGTIEGRDITVPKEFVAEINQKIDELMNIENDLDLMLIPIDLIEQYELNMEDIEGLMIMIQPFEFTSPPIYE